MSFAEISNKVTDVHRQLSQEFMMQRVMTKDEVKKSIKRLRRQNQGWTTMHRITHEAKRSCDLCNSFSTIFIIAHFNKITIPV